MTDQPAQPIPTETLPNPPLAEIDAEALEKFFLADPLDLTEPDIVKIVDHFRAERFRYAELEAQGKRQTKAKAPKTKGTQIVDLDSLDL